MSQEEIDKFLANTKVHVEGNSKEIQEKLFSLGYRWYHGGVQVRHCNSPYLFIYPRKYFTRSNDMEHFNAHGNRKISAEEILSINLT